MMNRVTARIVKNSTTLNTAVPPIDAIAPARTETATFALG
jgi:hypothetical protein